MENKKNIALFDRYLNNEMSGDEKLEFEQKLKEDESFQKEFEDYKGFIDIVAESATYASTLEKLDIIHEKLYPTNKRPFFLRPGFYVPISLVAGIALLVMIFNPEMGSDGLSSNEDSYEELRYPEESSEDAGESDNEGNDDEVYESVEPTHMDTTFLPPIYKQPKGTAFLISDEGYFLTAGHLVEDKTTLKLQNKDLELTFEVDIIYADTIMDFAILRCDEAVSENFERVPFKFHKSSCELGDDVFTLGFPKKEIVYTDGVVSSENGYKSDSLYFEISMPANPGNSGAPLFTKEGKLCGIITANNSKQQSVTYVLKHQYIESKLKELEERDSIYIDISDNYSKRFSTKSRMIKKYRPFIFEVH